MQVILCHGYAGSKDGFVYPQMAKALALKGLSSLRQVQSSCRKSHTRLAPSDACGSARTGRVLVAHCRFDFSGNGESEGAFEFGNYLQEVCLPKLHMCVPSHSHAKGCT